MMARISPDMRARLTTAAAELAYRRGFENTSLADIAKAAKIPLGNLYYYFKTKQAIAEAIIAERAREFVLMRAAWERAVSPRERLNAFIQMTVENRNNLARSGCPIGSLCSELRKESPQLASEAGQLFTELLKWLESQFEALGRGADKHGLALHLLASVQGVSLLSNSVGNPEWVLLEARHLTQWVANL